MDPHLSDYERNLFDIERKAEYRLEADESSDDLIVVPPKFSARAVFTSAPVWASLVVKFSSGLGYYVLVTKMPEFLSELFHVDIKDNGLYSASPFLGILISKTLCLKLSDWLIAWNKLSLTNVRKFL